MDKVIRIFALHCLVLQCLTAPSHDSGGHGGGGGKGKYHGPLSAVPDVHSYSKLEYPEGKLIDLGEYSKGELPVKTIKIIKTYAIKVPHPYPVKIKHSVPVPYPVPHPYPVTVSKIVKVPHPVPVEVIKRVEVPVHSNGGHSGHYSNPGSDYGHQDIHQDTSGGYSETGDHQAITGNPAEHLVQFRYNENFGGGAEPAISGLPHEDKTGSETVFQQNTHNYAAFPQEDLQQQLNYGPLQVSHHGIQDGVDGYSIHTVSGQPGEQQPQFQALVQPQHHDRAADAGESAGGSDGQLQQQQSQIDESQTSGGGHR